MTILDCPQRSDAWFAARRGLPTCSAFDKILTAGKGIPSSAQDKLISELIAEALCPTYGPDYTSADMQAGTGLEAEARAFYAFERGLAVREVGLIISDCGRFGGSPDALVGEDGGLEIKCPSAPTQITYVRVGQLPDDYKCQVHGHLVVSGRQWWDFLSYYPGLPTFQVRVTPDAFTAKLAAELEKFCARYNEVRATFGLAPIEAGKGTS